jgi:hypothetical protein
MAPNPSQRIRLATAALATLCALALALYPALKAHGSFALTAPLAIAGVVILTFGLVRRVDAAIAVSIALLAAEYELLLHANHRALSLVTPLYAAGLVLVAELAYWSRSEEIFATTRRRLPRRATTVAIAGAAGGALAAISVGSARSASTAATWLEPTGLTAGIAALLIIVALARRASKARG